ncbi:unnamed protein product [Acanthoscelides obtectus]|uniref:Uncharacterized protein n=1 Tax=Acanthoscelides obtectus TaxID=200917 RepID=A0A9P0P5M7_ACAOB|nr:unnamed protein product [Acanthoscelides obtectus]CAK1633513.1 hypothetical protein AOBTE_LOCUS8187 [Acanthoscelides obtectus]
MLDKKHCIPSAAALLMSQSLLDFGLHSVRLQAWACV